MAQQIVEFNSQNNDELNELLVKIIFIMQEREVFELTVTGESSEDWLLKVQRSGEWQNKVVVD